MKEALCQILLLKKFLEYSTWLTVKIWPAKCYIKEEKINFQYFYFNINCSSFFINLKLLWERILDSKLVCAFYLTVHHFLLLGFCSKSNLHHWQKMSAEKHNVHANSEIKYFITLIPNMHNWAKIKLTFMNMSISAWL